MIAGFVSAFTGAASAISSIFLVMLIAGLMVRRNVLTKSQVSGLSAATVNLFLPCLIFTKVTETLDPKSLPGWWALPLAGIAMALVGTGIGAVFFLGRLPAQKDLLPLAGMQNAGYLVLPVGLAMFPDQFDSFALYVFLFILGYNPILWSLGKILVSGNTREKTSLRDLVTPPLIANLVAIAFALSGASKLIPRPALTALELLGSAAVPVATLVLGAVLGGIGVRVRPYLADATRALAVKLLVLPAVTITVLHLTGLHLTNPLLAEFFVIEAAAAPAVATVLQVKTYGGDELKVGSVMFLSYLACMVTLPAWVAVWRLIAG